MSCDFCGKSAAYDFKMKMGAWALACAAHWRQYRCFPDLGTGKGQKL